VPYIDIGWLRAVWKRAFSLAWPVMSELTFRTAMRTTDVLVTAPFSPAAVAALGAVTVGATGLLLVVGAPWTVGLFTEGSTTAAYAADFTRVYGFAAAVLVAFSAPSGGLQGAGETRIHFVARTTEVIGFFLGVSWLLGETLGFGPVGAYVGLLAPYAWMALVVAWESNARTGPAGPPAWPSAGAPGEAERAKHVIPRPVKSGWQREPGHHYTVVRKVPPPSGWATGRKPRAGDRWLWNRDETASLER